MDMGTKTFKGSNLRVAAIALLIMMSSCITSMSGDMKQWIGHDESEIISKWGAPNRTATLSDSTKVLTWETPYDDAMQGERPRILTCNRSFTFSKAGTAIKWSANGCPPYPLPR